MKTHGVSTVLLVFASFLIGAVAAQEESASGFTGICSYYDSSGKLAKTLLKRVRIVFVSEDGKTKKEVMSGGTYRIRLPKGRYKVRAFHKDFIPYSTQEGFFVNTGEGFQTANILFRWQQESAPIDVRKNNVTKRHPGVKWQGDEVTSAKINNKKRVGKPKAKPAKPQAQAESASGFTGICSPHHKRLITLCKHLNLTYKQLKKELIALQWSRLVGQSPLPPFQAPGELEKKRLWLGRKRPPIVVRQLNPEERAAVRRLFASRPALKEKFLLALRPGYDNYPEAARVLLRVSSGPDDLAVAYAVVWDDPKLVEAAAKYGVPELLMHPPRAPTLQTAFDWYRQLMKDKANWYAAQHFQRLPWQLQTYVVSDGTSLAERNWVLSSYGSVASPARISTLGSVYKDIRYDQEKVLDHKGDLGNQTYTLSNLKQFGGICRDQAYFARAVCRAYGLPAYKATSRGNTGLGHAWVGWVFWDGPTRTYRVAEYGRYAEDKFFTSNIVEPQTGCFIKDYTFAVEAKGLSQAGTYQEAEVYYRVYEEVGQEVPEVSRTALVRRAVRRNPFHRQSWLAIGQAVASGAIFRSTAAQCWEFLYRNMREYPDFTFSMLSLFGRQFKSFQARMRFYEQSAKLFDRQDLLAKLRIEQIEVCCKKKQYPAAAYILNANIERFSTEGPQTITMAKLALKVFEKIRKRGRAIKMLMRVRSKIKKERMGFLSPYWKEMTELLQEACVKERRTADAQNLSRELKEAESTLRTPKPIKIIIPIKP